METDSSLRAKALKVGVAAMRLFSRCNTKRRSYMSELLYTAYLKGLRAGYWMGMNDAKEVLFREHRTRCKEDFEYWAKHNIVINESKTG